MEVEMPNKNGKGPEGKGSLSGNRLGNCTLKETLKDERTQKRGYGHRDWCRNANRQRQRGRSGQLIV